MMPRDVLKPRQLYAEAAAGMTLLPRGTQVGRAAMLKCGSSRPRASSRAA